MKKKYIGVKVIEALPAWKCKYENGNVVVVIGDEKSLETDIFVASAVESTFGYKVIYPDGYESWSPKEVFEESYQELLNTDCVLKKRYDELQPYEKRVIEEKSFLQNLFNNLDNFLQTDDKDVPKEKLVLLKKQAFGMLSYLNILKTRINNF